MIESSPTLRIRINHSRTIKEGWGYDTTVELTTPANEPAIEQAITYWLERARELGETERNIRNARDRKEASEK